MNYYPLLVAIVLGFLFDLQKSSLTDVREIIICALLAAGSALLIDYWYEFSFMEIISLQPHSPIQLALVTIGATGCLVGIVVSRALQFIARVR